MSREQNSSIATELMPSSSRSSLLSIDGQTLRDMLKAGRIWLARHKEIVNAQNVFPVPDGDTGTNMSQTMAAACRDLRHGAHAGKMAQRAASGAFMGARGNSGVILSLILRGFAEVVGEHERIDGRLFAAGLRKSAEIAYQGVNAPVEGTILTIIRTAADSATAHKDETFPAIFEKMLIASHAALANTPNQLPILKQAGVVDSGGQGLVYLLEGMVQGWRGELQESAEDVSPASDTTPQALARPTNGQIENRYDVQFLLQGDALNFAQIRQEINAMGDSGVIVGDERLIKVHIHVNDPGKPLSYAVSLGAISDVVVENMQLQMEAIINGENDVFDSHMMDAELQAGQIGVVAVAAGAGLRMVLGSLGVSVVVDGGQTNNPSTEEIYAAIERVPSSRIVVLPNNKNIIMTAKAAGALSDKQVVVVPTRTVPQGIGAMIDYAPDGELEDVAKQMEAAAGEIGSAEITRAVRNTTLNGIDVREGELIGIIDGKLNAASTQLSEMIRDTLTHLDMDERELLTLYYGADVTQSDAQTVAQQISQLYPEIEIEIVDGGQPHYFYILGVE